MTRRITQSLIALTLIFLSVTVYAQQDPYYTHFKFNKQAYNPGAVGTVDGVICVNGVAHRQWMGFDDQTFVDRKTGNLEPGGEIIENVAPQTYNANIGGQISTNKGTNTIGAVGLSVYSDLIGFQKTTSFRLQGAYFVPIQGNFARLALGFEAGMHQFGYDNPRFKALNPGDPRIPTSSSNDTKFDVGFGAYYKQRRLGNAVENFYAGLSATHLTQPTFNIAAPGNSTIDHQLETHIYFLTGADVELTPSLVLEPAVLLKHKAKMQFDLNVTALYLDMVRAGVGYRQWGTIDALSLMLGYKRDLANSNTVQVGYSYDITLSKIQTVSNGTHEIFVSYCFPLNVTKKPPTKQFHRNTRWL